MTPTIETEILDKLVDNELDETARAELIRALDASPDGWKRCALAFLEAQAWNGALRTAAPDTVNAVAVRPASPSIRTIHPFARHFSALAAAVVVAFCAGFVSRGADQRRPIASATTAVPAPSGAVPSTQDSPPPQSHALKPPAHTVPYVPEPVRLRMERQGYQITGDRKLVPLALSDGRRVAVPVDTVSYRYVGQRIQ